MRVSTFLEKKVWEFHRWMTDLECFAEKVNARRPPIILRFVNMRGNHRPSMLKTRLPPRYRMGYLDPSIRVKPFKNVTVGWVVAPFEM